MLRQKISFINGEEMNRLHPATFEIPSENFRRNVPDGAYVKVGLKKEGEMSERFWAKVTKSRVVDGNIRYEAEVSNDLVFYNYKFGDKIGFGPENVLGYTEN
ncbi:hypothetical protein PP935_gp112 [Rhizobium phage RHph_N34]|uniref:DUF2314 domain-containing protein n=1 Tax=Rhizobium phage RHph_N34 TaxID=2509586 RepID=A0A7S5RA22_9CAUD|nr:hypothetical protein PP935_gp112 [Rhizobium phage RHph_N34]QIG73887.1 hypothetical protein EVC06_112 [Rhizobium phage RHph_N34]